MSWVDRAIAAVSPRWAFEREQFRDALELQRDFSAAMGRGRSYRGAQSKRVDDFSGGGESADATLLWGDLDALRNRSRELLRDSAIASAVASAFVDGVVGTGLRPEPKLDPEALGIDPERALAVERKAEEVWRRWVGFAASDLRMDFYGLQRLVVRKLFEDGEVFARPILTSQRNRPQRTTLDLIEADRIDDPMAGGTGATPNWERIRRGIEVSPTGLPVAYWIAQQHPGDTHGPADQSARRFRRVSAFTLNGARNVFHVFAPTRPGQSRGVSLLAPVLKDLKDLESILEAERIAQRVAACFTAFVRTRTPAAEKQARRIRQLEPGRVEYMNHGDEISFGDPKRPGSQFLPIVEHLVRRIGACVRRPLEAVLMDFTRTNFVSWKAASTESRRTDECYRHLLRQAFCQPSYDAVIEEAVVTGEIDVEPADFYARRDLWCATEWLGDGYRSVEPARESAATKTLLELGLTSEIRETRHLGHDWERIQDERLEWEMRAERRRKELGATEEPEPEDATDAGDGDDDSAEEPPAGGNPDGGTEDEPAAA